MDWYEGNFFPPTLPIRSAKDTLDAPFKPLSAMLKIWGSSHSGPPGFLAQVSRFCQPRKLVFHSWVCKMILYGILLFNFFLFKPCKQWHKRDNM